MSPIAAPVHRGEDAVERWNRALDVLEVAAGDLDEPGLDERERATLPPLPPELEDRARKVLARLAEATAEVAGRMATVQHELVSTPRRASVAQPRSTALDVEA